MDHRTKLIQIFIYLFLLLNLSLGLSLIILKYTYFLSGIRSSQGKTKLL